MRWWMLVTAWLALPMAAMAQTTPATVVVLDTLHQMHATVPAYDNATLGRAIERLRPDVLCVELQPGDLAARPPEETKQEYPAVIYPLIDRHHYRVYAMEPAEPLYGALLAPYRANTVAFSSREPALARALGQYVDGLYAVLKARWTSPAAVNDEITDTALRGKHALQEALMGPAERTGWEAWNGHLLEVVERAARENPGRRVVVLVGAEHGYWLRGHLRAAPGVTLLDTPAALDGLGTD
ncbi:hypothetical protein [Frateuria soli]|uniref:hypothetical protein n=1 Tax=Frateuria soli TaxID=1542730 RepID=UPI001E490D37|nr:hypothetical protein [Frateuria soli]UGB37189.1 hypothetical protein LQ771_10110 [Frateuria soli]